jgi:glutathione synthase/RimK-type ligase-like ATP-grasp enzyme
MKKTIIQTGSFDRSTDDILFWLNYYNIFEKKEIVIFNDDNLLNEIDIRFDSESINYKINDKSFNNNDSFWYRRGQFKFFDTKTNNKFINDSINNINNSLLNFLNDEVSLNQTNKNSENYIEKLKVLKICAEYKIKYPKTIITNKLDSVISFFKEHKVKNIITKPLQNYNISTTLNDVNFGIDNIVNVYSIEEIMSFDSNMEFYFSIFQEYIDKKYEIRSFFLNGKFKSMAIFSQENEKTKFDYRNYDYVKPNRCVPFKLPNSIENKLVKLMKNLKMKSGSFDLICTNKNEFVFLEVNPIGQFQWLSKNCNFYIEKDIANNLK